MIETAARQRRVGAGLQRAQVIRIEFGQQVGHGGAPIKAMRLLCRKTGIHRHIPQWQGCAKKRSERRRIARKRSAETGVYVRSK
jgi:hypothetical protein